MALETKAPPSQAGARTGGELVSFKVTDTQLAQLRLQTKVPKKPSFFALQSLVHINFKPHSPRIGQCLLSHLGISSPHGHHHLGFSLLKK